MDNVYILVRTTIKQKHDHFRAMIESVAKQSYPQLKLLILVDTHGASEEQKPDHLEYLKEYNLETIITSADCGNSAKALLTLREHFCALAQPQDIAIQLDDDDELAADAATLIAHKMAASRADICMIGYAEGHDNVTSLIKDQSSYGRLLSSIESLDRECYFKDISRLHLAATMGWTKCYTQKTLKTLCEIIKACDTKRAHEQRKQYGDIATCEDFVDFATLLLRDTYITAIAKPLYIYKRHQNSVTFSLKPESFSVDRIGFLRYLQEIIHDNYGHHFDRAAAQASQKFVKYKMAIIAKILENRFQEYTADNLFADLNYNNPNSEIITQEEAFALLKK